MLAPTGSITHGAASAGGGPRRGRCTGKQTIQLVVCITKFS